MENNTAPASLLTRLRTRRLGGFTLLELIVVLIVLAILALIAIPSYTAVKDRAADKVAETSLQAMLRDAAALAAFDGRSAINAADLATAASEMPTAEALAAAGGAWALTDPEDTPATAEHEVSYKLSGSRMGVATVSGSGHSSFAAFNGLASDGSFSSTDPATGSNALAGEGNGTGTTTTTAATTTTTTTSTTTTTTTSTTTTTTTTVPAATVYLNDTFTDVDGTFLINHTPDVNLNGQPWVNANPSSFPNNPKIMGNQMASSTGSSGGLASINLVDGAMLYDASFDLAYIGAGVNQYYTRFGFGKASINTDLAYFSDATHLHTQGGSDIPVPDLGASDHTIRMTANQETGEVSIYLDGNLISTELVRSVADYNTNFKIYMQRDNYFVWGIDNLVITGTPVAPSAPAGAIVFETFSYSDYATLPGQVPEVSPGGAAWVSGTAKKTSVLHSKVKGAFNHSSDTIDLATAGDVTMEFDMVLAEPSYSAPWELRFGKASTGDSYATMWYFGATNSFHYGAGDLTITDLGTSDHHVKVTQSGNDFEMFLDGVSQGTWTDATTAALTRFGVAAFADPANWSMDNLAITAP